MTGLPSPIGFIGDFPAFGVLGAAIFFTPISCARFRPSTLLAEAFHHTVGAQDLHAITF